MAGRWHYAEVIPDEELIETAVRLAELPDIDRPRFREVIPIRFSMNSWWE